LCGGHRPESPVRPFATYCGARPILPKMQHDQRRIVGKALHKSPYRIASIPLSRAEPRNPSARVNSSRDLDRKARDSNGQEQRRHDQR
jgi:hypothetical protein